MIEHRAQIQWVHDQQKCLSQHKELWKKTVPRHNHSRIPNLLCALNHSVQTTNSVANIMYMLPERGIWCCKLVTNWYPLTGIHWHTRNLWHELSRHFKSTYLLHVCTGPMGSRKPVAECRKPSISKVYNLALPQGETDSTLLWRIACVWQWFVFHKACWGSCVCPQPHLTHWRLWGLSPDDLQLHVPEPS